MEIEDTFLNEQLVFLGCNKEYLIADEFAQINYRLKERRASIDVSFCYQEEQEIFDLKSINVTWRCRQSRRFTQRQVNRLQLLEIVGQVSTEGLVRHVYSQVDLERVSAL